MVDTRTQKQRSAIMRSVRTKNTGPEILVRRKLHALGYRFRLHRKDLPGKPDIVLPVRRKAIFVHGCFWHGHDCPKGRLPKSKLEYWEPKIKANIERDRKRLAELRTLGWSVLVLWQCQIVQQNLLESKLLRFLDP